MTSDETARRPRRILRRLLKGLAVAAMLVVAVLAAWHFIWKYSGSNKWELVMDRGGIKVYSLKAPGSVLNDFKAVRRLRMSLTTAVAAMTSTQTEDCADWSQGCVSVEAVQPWSPERLSYVHLFRVQFPSPFAPREMLVKAQASQDPRSRTVKVEFTGRPDDLPRNQCCVRVPVYHNVWRFTPVGNGEIEVELSMHMDQKMPYFIVNHLAPRAMYSVFSYLPTYFNKEKWRRARFDSITEAGM